MNALALLLKRLRRAVLRRRRVLAALAAATAVAAGLQAASAPPPPKATVLTASRDIPGGTVVRSSDLAPVEFDPESVPTGVLASHDVVGRTTAIPVRSGEPITDVRLVSGSMLAAYPDMVAAPVRIGDPGAVALLRIGDRVDVLAADPNGAGQARVVAEDVAVIAIPKPAETGGSMVTGGLVVVAIPEETVLDLAGAGVSHYLSVVINH